MTYFTRTPPFDGALRKMPALLTDRGCSGCMWGRLTEMQVPEQCYSISNINGSLPATDTYELRLCYWDEAPDTIQACDCTPSTSGITSIGLFPSPKKRMFVPCASRLVTEAFRRIYAFKRDGGANTTPLGAQVGIDRTIIANRNHPDEPHDKYQWNGAIYWVAIWNQDVGERVCRQLNLGAHPFFTRSQGLLAFLPLQDAHATVDWIGSYWSIIGSNFTSGVKPFQLARRQKMQRVYGAAAVPISAEGRTVVGM